MGSYGKIQCGGRATVTFSSLAMQWKVNGGSKEGKWGQLRSQGGASEPPAGMRRGGLAHQRISGIRLHRTEIWTVRSPGLGDSGVQLASGWWKEGASSRQLLAGGGDIGKAAPGDRKTHLVFEIPSGQLFFFSFFTFVYF